MSFELLDLDVSSGGGGGGGGGPVAAVLENNAVSTTVTPGSDATNLAVYVEAGKTYLLRGRFTFRNARISITAPAGSIGIGRLLAKPDPTTAGVRTTIDSSFGGAVPSAIGHLTLQTEGEYWGRITVVTSGFVTIRISSGSAASHTTIFAGSALEARELTSNQWLAADKITTLAAGEDTLLTAALLANSVYLVRVYGRGLANGTNIRFAFTYPAGLATITGWHTGFGAAAGSEANRQAVAAFATVTTITSGNGAAIGNLHTWLRVKTGANPGTLTLQIATSTGGSPVTLFAGAVMTADKMTAEV